MHFEPSDNRIVIWGMSCVGKTTFANTMKSHTYYCFDALFQWHLIETFGLSATENFKYIQRTCDANKFVIDGWNLADKKGEFFPNDCTVYILWAPYEKIISQYRVPVLDQLEHKNMYKKWYHEIDISFFPKVKFFLNDDTFQEISKKDYLTFLEHNQ